LATLLYGCLPQIINWNILLLTESLSIVETTVLFYFTASFIREPQKKTAILSSIMVVLLVLTRPAMIYLLPVYALFWIMEFVIDHKSRQNKAAILAGVYSFLAGILMIVGYCAMMLAQHGTFGLSTVSNINRAWMIRESGIEVKSDNVDVVAAFSNPDPYLTYDVLEERLGSEEAGRVVDRIIGENRLTYYRYLLKKAVTISGDRFGAIYARAESASVGMANSFSLANFGLVYAILLAGIIYIIWSLIKAHEIDWWLAFLVAFIFCNVVISVFMAPEETQRLCAVSIPALIMLGAYWLNTFYYKERKLAMKEKIVSKKATGKIAALSNKLFMEETTDAKIQFLRYFFVGGIAAVVNIGALFVLKESGVNLIVANIIGFTLGLIVNYLLSRKFVFAKEKMENGIFEFVSYAVIGVIGLAIDTFLVWLFTEQIGMWYIISKVLSTVIVFVWNFVARKVLYINANRSKKGKDAKAKK